MPNPTDRDVELSFSSNKGRALFPSFCNSLIALEAPQTATFPILTTRAGPDGGIDGEWDLTGVTGFVPVSIATAGWNVYQFKTVDVVALGDEKAFADLCKSARGAVKDLLNRQTEAKTLERYVLFTNLRLGPESEATTASGGQLNTRPARLRAEVLKDSSRHIDVAIVDAGQIAGFIARHPALARGWFSSGSDMAWNEMQQWEQRKSGVDVPLVGREVELVNLQGWLGDPDVRVIAVTGPNSVGKTRLVIDATKPLSAVTFFVGDVHALLHEGVRAYATTERPLVLVVEDPPVDEAKRLADQTVGCERPIKLIVTLPSPEHAPVVRLGDDAVVKPYQIQRLQKEAGTKLVASIDSGLENRLRDWIVQQAGGVPGVLIAAARLGEALHRESGSLRKQLSRSFRQRLEVRAGQDALPLLQALSPLTYVKVSSESSELPTLLSLIAPEIQAPSVLRRLGELESLGFLRRQGSYVAVVPPMFAAGLFYDLVQNNPALPGQLMVSLDLASRKRLLERLVTLELTEEIPFAAFVFGADGPFGDAGRSRTNLELLEYLARALPQATARFLLQRIDFIWLDVVREGQNGMQYLLAAIGELLDEATTSKTAFAILTDLATREAGTLNTTDVTNDFVECYVYWYPRSIPYSHREAVLEPMLTSLNPALRRLGLKAIMTATNPPDTLSGRSVTVRRIGGKPHYGSWKDCWDFLLRMVRRRLVLCTDADPAVKTAALEKLPNTISRLSRHLGIDDALQMVREIAEPYFQGTLPIDPVDLRDNVKELRHFYERSSKELGQEQWHGKWEESIAELDVLLARLETGAFDHRLRLAVGRSSDYGDVVFEDQKLYEYQVPILQLAREACREPSVMTDSAWNVLGDKEALNRHEFAVFLGDHDEQHLHFSQLLVRAVGWPWANLLAAYLSAATKTNSQWVEQTLDEMLVSPATSKGAVLIAICAIGPTEANRSRLKQMLLARSVSQDEVANAFSVGRWLDNLPVEEVRHVLEFILSEPDRESAMMRVTSLYLHHKKPLPRGLFAVVIPALKTPFPAHTRETYDIDQVATALARTDLDAGLEILLESVQWLSDVKSGGWMTGWNPVESYGTRDFWEFLRTEAPQRAYGILGEWNIKSPGPERMHIGNGRHLLDLQSHQEVILELAKANRNAACIFVRCAHRAQPDFFQFAYRLVEFYSNDEGVVSALNSALVQTSGFGYEYDWHTSAIQTVQTELDGPELSPAARSWLERLHAFLLQKRAESRRDFGSSEPSFLE